MVFCMCIYAQPNNSQYTMEVGRGKLNHYTGRLKLLKHRRELLELALNSSDLKFIKEKAQSFNKKTISTLIYVLKNIFCGK